MSTSVSRLLAGVGAAVIALCIVFGAAAGSAAHRADGNDPTPPPPTTTSVNTDGGNPWHG
ncbi:hypothetical protein [Kutzneria sp. 744]|jgi:hypothetical protein|uniref:hypothetical protein n=1 Tax=Kutzneria sp. (strain 744) TaxID=345341 RepID=UPI0003EEDC9F|nr:hypothetical protein [Kutzneria sp. 744]EWM13509.1 hypothetical protein KUTG_03813 [Kutzneria sp. 744]